MTQARCQTRSRPRFFISAAELSGDLHAASLIREILRRRPDARFIGVAGPNMRQAGCHPVADLTTHAAMLAGALTNVLRAARALQRTSHEFANHHYDAAIVVDSPMINLPVALRAKMRGIPVLYYIAPQLWAWGAYRLHKVGSRVDKLAVVLPFEQEFFRNVGLDATFVGHPLFDILTRRAPDPDAVGRMRSAGRPVIAILPGSRTHVIRAVLPGQLQVAAAIRDRFPNARFGVSLADTAHTQLVQSQIHDARIHADLLHNRNSDLLSAADLTLVASGTATLEVAYYRSPMIVMYNGSRLLYHLLGRWMIGIEHLSLVNILAGRRLVPEFMPYYTSTAPIVEAALDLLSSPERLDRMRTELADTISPINKPGASARTADMLLEMVNANPH